MVNKGIKEKVDNIGKSTWEDMEKAELVQTVDALVYCVDELEKKVAALENVDEGCGCGCGRCG